MCAKKGKSSKIERSARFSKCSLRAKSVKISKRENCAKSAVRRAALKFAQQGVCKILMPPPPMRLDINPT